jgi:asparagine synthase (glutamine-hydrolysing)
MTAIAGIWSISGSSDPLADCQRMLKAQQIYAADRPICAAIGAVALGRRLFKLVPEDVHDQGPVTGAGGRWTLVADVRLDNRDELAGLLDIPPAEARILADAAIVLRAIDCWEEGAVQRLMGDFALAAYDARRERLLLARDFLGQRPLHFRRCSTSLAFASMPKGLRALPDVPTSADEEAIAKFLALMPESGTQSFFDRIERVPPGHFCLFSRSGFSATKYWNPPPEPLRLRNSEEYAEALREQFDRAVSVRLRGSGGRVAAHLSSGLDSSAVAATAARLLLPEGRVTAFTSVPREGFAARLPRGRFADEGPLAAEAAALHPNMEHVLIRGAGKSPFTDLDRNFHLYDRPVLNGVNHVWAEAIMAAAKARGLTVMLTGSRGNMSISYSGLELLPELLKQGRLLRLAREAAMLRRGGGSAEGIAAHIAGPYLPRWLWRLANRVRGRGMRIEDYSAINPRRAEALKAEAAEAGLDFNYRPRADPFGTRLWALTRTDPGNYNKGYLGGWGIDARDPTADRGLVELCLRIPAEQFLSGGVTRALARRAFADRLPASLLQETRSGYQAADWHEGLTAGRPEAAVELDRILASPAAAGALDTQLLASLIEDWPQKDWNSHRLQGLYRLALVRGLTAGHFIRKAEGSNQ